MMDKNPNPKLHTLWAFTPATAQPKMPKEYAIAITQKLLWNNWLECSPNKLRLGNVNPFRDWHASQAKEGTTRKGNHKLAAVITVT